MLFLCYLLTTIAGLLFNVLLNDSFEIEVNSGGDSIKVFVDNEIDNLWLKADDVTSFETDNHNALITVLDKSIEVPYFVNNTEPRLGFNNESIFLQQLKDQGLIDRKLFSVTNTSLEIGGEAGDNAVPLTADFEFQIDGVDGSKDEKHVSILNKTTARINLNKKVSTFPHSTVQLLRASFPGLHYNDGDYFIESPCDSLKGNLTFTIGNNVLRTNVADWVYRRQTTSQDTECSIGIQLWDNEDVELGSNFFNLIESVIDLEDKEISFKPVDEKLLPDNAANLVVPQLGLVVVTMIVIFNLV